ncbi:PREDICTED: uncharacterized protein LOC109214315 [Nicotiana attenuata]|uniref:uncharacterized protein LOC109214315 n=1 Tax=Nicotiana attenuata TaxID=49451 RepID=UPI0009055CCA|nr:PREDICTED: uncharacterized protein LOC109214315 [Nicotiana attenuata]
MIISQRKFVLDLLREYECLHSPALTSPLDPTIKLKAKEGAPLSDPTFYRKLVGKLNFLTNTKLDIAYGVQHLSQFMQDPREPHLQAAYHMLRYLKKDPTLGLYFSNSDDLSLVAYCDSDWEAAPSVGNPRNKKPYPSLQQRQNTELLEMLSALHIARNPVFHERSKHIEVDCHFVRAKLQGGLISLHHIGTGKQLADVLTKVLTGIKHRSVLGKLGVISSHPT